MRLEMMISLLLEMSMPLFFPTVRDRPTNSNSYSRYVRGIFVFNIARCVQYDQMSPAAQTAVRAWKPVDASGAIGDTSQRTWSLVYSLVKCVCKRVLDPCNLYATPLNTQPY